MNFMVTKFEKQLAKPCGNLFFMDMCPEEFRQGTIFHGVSLEPKAVLDPEFNNVMKTFIIFDGTCEVEVDGETATLTRGDMLWLPKGSTHIIRNSDRDLFFVVVKKDA